MFDQGASLVTGTETVMVRLERLLDRVECLLATAGEGAMTKPEFEKYSAFRWERRGSGGTLVPVVHPHLVELDGLVGIDYVKAELTRNTERFVQGHRANNVLLWGERGTGKSSCVKGLMKRFAASALRMIEIQRTDLMSLPRIAELTRGEPYRFILFCDDLSFAEGDATYQDIKTLLDGGLEERPENLLVYATSNRRHLMPERMDDNLGGEIHPDEAVSDKLALADRFGLTLGFYPFDQDTYLQIVKSHARERGVSVPEEELCREAIRWAMYKGQRSGRAARQFVDDLAGRPQGRDSQSGGNVSGA